MGEIVIAPMEQHHLDEVLAIEESSFTTPWSRDALERELTENTLAVYIVATEDGRVVGYAGMWHVVTEGHITNVAVTETCRRRGIAGMMLKWLLDTAEHRGMMGVTLEVRITNAAAQRLYTKYGFKPEGFRKQYYTDTKEDAVIMWKYFM